MEWEEFRIRVTELKSSRPLWFELESDARATEHEIRDAEASLGVTLPGCYRKFVREWGGGYFAFGNVFSVEPNSDWNIVRRNRTVCLAGFISVSDNGTGDYYGFKVVDGACGERVYFWDHEEPGSLRETAYVDLFEMLDAIALRPS